jgi:anaerobic C4-dicarboxylate transporter
MDRPVNRPLGVLHPERPVSVHLVASEFNTMISPTPACLFAASYIDGFIEYWRTSFRTADNVVLLTIIVGAVCISIILSSGRWKK